jgi:hypothetical protein
MIRIQLLIPLLLLFAAQAHAAPTKFSRSYLKTGEVLKTDEYMVSGNDVFYVIMQSNGRLAVHKGSGPSDDFGLVWESPVPVHPPLNPNFTLELPKNEALTIFEGRPPHKLVAWHSDGNPKSDEAFLAMQEDGNLVVYKGTGPSDNKGFVWSTIHAAIPVTWIPHGKSIRSLYRLPGHEYLAFGKERDYRVQTPKLWASLKEAQRWVFLPDGLHWAHDKSKCLDVDKQSVVLADCNHSDVQKGWSYDAQAHKIKNSALNSCMFTNIAMPMGYLIPELVTNSCIGEPNHGMHSDANQWSVE